MIKYEDLVKKTMPPEKLSRAKVDIIPHYLLRPIENIISIPLIEKKVNPTVVTKLSGFFALLALPLFAFGETSGFIGGWLMIFIWNILDGIDGNIARYNDQCSDNGALWDMAMGFLAVVVFYVGMGVTAFKSGDRLLDSIDNAYFLLMGASIAICNLFPRMIMYFRWYLQGKESTKTISGREEYGLIKRIIFNITSINGLCSIFFLIAFFLRYIGSLLFLYFLLYIAVAIYSTLRLLREN